MKLCTSPTVVLTSEEAYKFLSKYIEKKTGKKVVGLPKGENVKLVFELAEEVSDIDPEKAS